MSCFGSEPALSISETICLNLPVFSWDKANAKVLAYRQKDPAAAGGADIPLPEVANAVDMSAVTFNWVAYGN